MRKVSKNPYAKLRKKTRTAFAKWIVKRDGGVCVTCGKSGNQAGHYIHRDCLDFNEEANSCQCSRCNLWLRGNLPKYTIYLEKKYGYGIVQELDRLSWKNRYFKVSELNEIIEKYGDNKSKQKKNGLSGNSKVQKMHSAI